MTSAAVAKEDREHVVLQELETMKVSFGDYCDTMRSEMDHCFQFDANFAVTNHHWTFSISEE